MRAWGPVTSPTARTLASWLCALWGRHEGARGGRLLPGCGASGVGRSPTPDCPPSGRAAGAHYPLAVGAGGCGRGDPSPAPQRALLRAGFALLGRHVGARGGASCLGVGRPGSGALRPPSANLLGGLPGPTTLWLWVRGGAGVGTRHQPHSARSCVLWGRHEGARGGRLLPGCGASGVGRSPTPDCPPSGRAAGARYPLAVGAGGCGGGDPSPTPQRALLRAGFARCGGGTRAPGGGASCLGVGRPGSGPLPSPTARPLGGLLGPTTHWLWVRGGAGVGTRHQPHSARSCELTLRAGGGGMRVPGGAPLAWVWGVRGRALCQPRALALWAGCRGPLATGCWYGGVRAWGPVTNPTARALASWLCALWGRHEGARGGRLLSGCGASGVRRSPTPDCPPSGRAAGAHYPLAVGAGGCGRGDPSPTPQRALLRAGFARCGGGMRVPGGGRLLPGCGASGVRRSANLHCPPSGRAAGAHYPLAVGAGGCGRGDPSPTPQRALLRAGFARCGGGMRVPGGGASCLGVGRLGSGALPPPTARPLGGPPGPTTHWLMGVGGYGCGDPSPTPQRALLRAGFARCGGGMRVPGGAPLAGDLGRPGSGTLPPPPARPLGGLPGPTTHWLWLRGGAGVGTRPQPHSARSCELALRAVRAARGRPGGGPPAWVWGVRGRALSKPRLPALWAGCRVALPTRCGCGGMRAWGPVTNPTARALASLLCALWGRHEGARGGRLLPEGGASGVERSPTPNCPPSGRAAGAHYPLVVGAGACGPGDPSPAPQRALLRAGFARCGGGMRVPGVAPLAWVWGVRGRALSHLRLPALWAGCRGPLPTGCGCRGVRVWGPVTNPTARALASWLCALWGPHEGARGVASCLGVGRPGSGALPPPTARPLGGLRGLTTHWLWVRGGAGVGTRHQPHSARSCELALRAVGAE